MTAVLEIPNLNDLIAVYLGGESLKQLSSKSGISRTALTKQFKKAGVQIRGRSDAELLKWSKLKTDPTAVQRQVGKAWEARRGAVDDFDRKMRRAQTRSRRRLHIGLEEQRLADALIAAGVSIKQQFPMLIYNIDIALHEDFIAVEVADHSLGRTCSHNLVQRTKDILNLDWTVLFIVGAYDRRVDIGRVTEQIIAYRDFTRSNPSALGKYAMIRSDGKGPTGRYSDLDGLPRVPGF